MNWLQLLSYQRSGDKEIKQLNEDQVRSAFEVDYDRIIFSHPFRRLQDKTQVFPMPEHDFVHTRLTHSLEVSSVGRSLGKRVGEALISKHPDLKEIHINPFDFGAIVAAASLAHDLGNPPFGHSGEDAISDYFINNPKGQFFKNEVEEKEWQDLTHFEGNAQGFRLLNHKGPHGLKLTLASLAAFTKYPRESLIVDRDKARKSQKKYGFFQSEKALFTDLATNLGLASLSQKEAIWCRHPLAFLVEAADDICYSIIDFEDGCRLGLVSFEQTRDLLSEIIGDKYDEAKLDKIPGKDEKIGVLRALAIGQLINESCELFIENESGILKGSFDSALTDQIPSRQVLSKIEKLSIDKIYRSGQVLEREAAGFKVIDGLLEVFTQAVYNRIFDSNHYSAKQRSIIRLLPEETISSLETPKITVYQALLIVTDFISGLTDSYALSLYRKINGISIPASKPY